MLHLAEVVPQLVFLDRIVHELRPQLHAGDRGLQVVGDRRQQLHALLQIRGDACLHRVEGAGGVSHFVRAFFVEVDRVGVGVEGFHRVGEAGEGADGDAHRQPGAREHQCQLTEQHHRQPRRQRHHRRTHIDGHRAAVAQAQVALKVLFRARNVGEGQRVCFADRIGDRGHRNRHFIRADRRARFAFAQQVTIVFARQTLEPHRALFGGQAVEDGNRGRDVGFEVAEHGVLRAFVALVILRAERQRLSEDQADQENQRQPGGEGARPAQGDIHAGAPRTSTGSENT